MPQAPDNNDNENDNSDQTTAHQRPGDMETDTTSGQSQQPGPRSAHLQP
jgi:hypothetical protein